MSSKVGKVLDQLSAGQIDASEAGKQIDAVRSKRSETRATDFETLAARELEDPGAIEENTFEEVMAAYHRGDIDEQQYGAIVDVIGGNAKKPKKSSE